MKRNAIALVALMVVSLCAATIVLAQATTKPSPSRAKYEYALAKWDGPDRIQIFYPDRLERFRVSDKVPLPKDVREEEFCVNTVINDLAKEGWEPIQLHASRVLFRRSRDGAR